MAELVVRHIRVTDAARAALRREMESRVLQACPVCLIWHAGGACLGPVKLPAIDG